MSQEEANEPHDTVAGPARRFSDFPITASHLISLDKLTSSANQRDSPHVPRLVSESPSVPTTLSRPEPEEYVGLDRLLGVVDDYILPLFASYDTSDFRVGPVALTRFMRGGKTRALKELGNELQRREKPVLFIAFTGQTRLNEHEAQLHKRGELTLLDSIVLRMTWACATEETVASLAEQIGKDPGDISFEDWIDHVSLDPLLLDRWLTGPLILLFDKLDQLVTKETLPALTVEGSEARAVAEFILSCLGAEDRYFVFSSHVATVGKSIRDYWVDRRSARDVYRLEIPRIEEPTEALAISPSASEGEICWTGRAPALLFELYRRSETSSNEGDVLEHFTSSKSVDTSTAPAVIRTALKGDPSAAYF